MIHNPSQAITLPTTVLQDATMEPLQILVKPYLGIKYLPADLSNRDTATMVFVELTKCFKKAGFVAEGLLGNVIWGFKECGYDENHVAAGLSKLRARGYIFYSDSFRNRIAEYGFDVKKPIWIRYTDKFKDLLIRE